MDELLVALKDIDSSDSDSSEKRRNMIEQHLDQIENTFKRLDSDRNDIVNNIKRSTNIEEEVSLALSSWQVSIPYRLKPWLQARAVHMHLYVFISLTLSSWLLYRSISS